MRLNKFKVLNFRSVTDSGWIEAEQVTALIGVNESGKTNLLLPLWKLNPAREGEIKPTSDYPKGNYAAVRGNPERFEFITAEFDCTDHTGELESLCGIDRKYLDIVQVTKSFDGNCTIRFPKYEPRGQFLESEIRKMLDETRAEVSSITPLSKESGVEPEIIREITTAIESVSEQNWGAANIEALATKLSGAILILVFNS